MKEPKAATVLDSRNASYWRALAEAQAAADDYVNAAKSWAAAEHAAVDEAERAKIHIARLAPLSPRADFTEAEKKRREEEAARDLERGEGRSGRGSRGGGCHECPVECGQRSVSEADRMVGRSERRKSGR